jgi:predicted transcriptional regulator of viral defense system
MDQPKVAKFLETTEASGYRYFRTAEIEAETGFSPEAVAVALSRYKKKGKVQMIRKGFGLICMNGREPDPTYYIDAMMKHMQCTYYVALLSASAHWGASHQASMSYQVMSSLKLKDTKFKRGRLQFIFRQTFPEYGYQSVSGIGGVYQVSSPELTSVDLVRYYKKCGYLNNVATILDSLVEKWDGRKAKKIFREPFVSTSSLQRLGFLLDEVLGHEKHANHIENVLKERQVFPIDLDPTAKTSGAELNGKWKVKVNTEVEPD